MELPAPKETETAFGYYRRLIDLAGGRKFLNKEEIEKISSALYESLESSLGEYRLNKEALGDLMEANQIL